MNDNNERPALEVGQHVEKVSGYAFAGPVVAVFQTAAGAWRVVVDKDSTGLLHIFAPHQLRVCFASAPTHS